MSQEKSILNDGVDCFAANLHKVRLKKREEKESRATNKFLDPLISCFAIIFLGMFIFVFFFLLITFWNVENLATVDPDSVMSSGQPSEGGTQSVASYLKVQPPEVAAAASNADHNLGQDLGDVNT